MAVGSVGAIRMMSTRGAPGTGGFRRELEVAEADGREGAIAVGGIEETGRARFNGFDVVGGGEGTVAGRGRRVVGVCWVGLERRRDLRHSFGRQGEAQGTEISTKRAFDRMKIGSRELQESKE
jgi:hypothetical protein